MIAVNDTTGRAAALRVNDDGELIVAGVSTGGGGTDATAAKQDTGNASLASIDTKSSTVISGLSSIDAHVDGLEASVASIDSKTPALGQALAAGSTPVVLTAAQVTALTPPAAITGFATAAAQTTANTSLAAIDTNAGAIADAAVAAGATGSIAAKLRRLTADIGALILQIPSALGKKTVATSLAANSKSGGDEYETVAASQTDQAMGATGATGDYIEGLVCVVATAATSQVQIKDGSGSAITVLPNAVGPGVGTYYVPLGLTSTSGAWKVTTAAGVSVIACGDFT
jgi:hypothetical protein